MRLDDRGQLLIEILVVMAVLAVIVSVASTVFLTSSKSSQSSVESNVARGLLEEELEVIHSVSMTSWHSLYAPPSGLGDAFLSKNSNYRWHIVNASGTWSFATNTESVMVNGMPYERYFFVENVSRNQLDGAVEPVYNVANDDPSTQKITAVVSWPHANPLSMVGYVTRWGNRVCVQSAWNGGLTNEATVCPTSAYGGDDGNIEITTTGSVRLKPQ